MAIREIDKARKFFFRVCATALAQRIASRRRQIGPGVYRTRPKRNKYGKAEFCAGEQECARRAVR